MDLMTARLSLARLLLGIESRVVIARCGHQAQQCPAPPRLGQSAGGSRLHDLGSQRVLIVVRVKPRRRPRPGHSESTAHMDVSVFVSTRRRLMLQQQMPSLCSDSGWYCFAGKGRTGSSAATVGARRTCARLKRMWMRLYYLSVEEGLLSMTLQPGLKRAPRKGEMHPETCTCYSALAWALLLRPA